MVRVHERPQDLESTDLKDYNSYMIENDSTDQKVEDTGKNYWKLVSLVLMVVILCIGFYIYWNNTQTNSSLYNGDDPTNPNYTLEDNSKKESKYQLGNQDKIEFNYNENEGWRRANNLSSISFEYPNGWHVASIWKVDNSQPISFKLDPEPYNGAPRGGPDVAITINDYSGYDDPEGILTENINKSKDFIENLEETTFETESGIFIKLEGEFNFYGEMVPYITYHAILRGPDTGNINTHIVEAQLTYFQDNDERDKYVEILDKVVKSMRHRDLDNQL